MINILKSYLKRLTNLTGNNRSLLLLRLSTSQFIDINELNFLNTKPSFSIIEDLIARKKKIPLCPDIDPRDKNNNQTSKKLRKIDRMDKFLFEERGSKDLYVGWPFIKGQFMDGTSVRAPLLFFPIQLKLENGKWAIYSRDEVGISFNKSFLLAYAFYNNVKITDDFIEKIIEDFDTDSTVFRTTLYQELKESPIELNFNQSIFENKLQNFEQYTKKDFENAQNTGELKLYPEAVLGIFPQSGSHLVPDYTYLIEEKTPESMESFFESRSSHLTEDHNTVFPGLNFIKRVKEENIITPFKMDAFQENALKAVKEGNSLVIQGPPGTGKSQLICNLISDFISSGKKVLVVSQKRAALDVVYARMKENNAESFVGIVHDFKNDRKKIYEKIANQIHRLDEYKIKNSSLDSIHLERNFTHNCRIIDHITEEMEEFKQVLFDESECGISIKELYLTSNLNEPSVNLKQEYRSFHFNNLNTFINKLELYDTYAQKFNKYDHPFYNRKSFKGHTIHDLSEMKNMIKEMPIYQTEVSDNIEKLLGYGFSIEEADPFNNKVELIKEMLGILKNPEIYTHFQHMQPYSDNETDLLWLTNTERVLMQCYHGVGPELSLNDDELGKFQETLQRNMEARKGLLKLVKWQLFSKDKYFIKRVLVANDLRKNKAGFKIMVEKIDNRLNLAHNLTKLKRQPWLDDIPANLSKVHLQNWFHVQRLALKSKLIFNSIRNFKDYFNIQKLTYIELQQKLNALYVIIKDIPEKKLQWSKYYSEHQIKHILEGGNFEVKVAKALQKDFDALCEYDNLLNSLTSDESKVIEKIYENVEQHDRDSLIKLFGNSIRLAWIDHIETKFPILRIVSSSKFQKMEKELQDAVKDKLLASNDILLLKARERTYENLEYNRLNNRVTYRDLNHQVTKKRKIWPLRKLISELKHELFDLVPVWLASPESASAIFPMEQFFDLVIFDEASQCFTEKGIPSIYRGKQIVIAGDNKQLRPNDLYKIRYEDENEEGLELEVDSLLELAEKYLMQVQLKGHYRSKSLELIDFSNTHFYGGKLRLLPNREDVNSQSPAIRFLKVDGIWENNTNRVEAEKVCEILIETIQLHPNKGIGVVTFNALQQNLITDIFEEKMILKKLSIPSSVFIKNIENIQGDEKDIIIFSTAYAPDTSGRLMMQFGSLNMENGENRLNVAITRAREKVIIVTSIFPQQLKVETSKNVGPKLLKEYLSYALDVSEGRYIPTKHTDEEHNNSWYLKAQLQNWSDWLENIEFTDELPFSDITIKENNTYLGLIITDDNLYYQSVSMKDTHAYTPFTLSSKKWRFKGIFSREYWVDREGVHESINRFINNSRE
ncbi:MAG: AAA domain-containing protein [Cyclobacteriaceae bacterium]|nr:AAA domain-containing protein [Cyclobacteriaceae bacterium]